MIPCWDHLSLAMIYAQSDLNLYPVGDSLFSSWIPTESSPEKKHFDQRRCCKFKHINKPEG